MQPKLWPLLISLAFSSAAQANLRFEEGFARDPESKKALYVEQHWVRFDQSVPVERLVLYRCMDGVPFARKHVQYQPSAQAPAFEFIDVRKGYVEGLRYRQNKPALWYRPPGSASEKNVFLAIQNLVVDAGFNEFIRINWLQLRTGKALPLRFAVPTRLQAYKFNLRQTGEGQFSGVPSVTYQLKLSGLLSLISDPIEVTYDKASRRLLRFQGLSNLRNDAGQFELMTQIDFPHPSRAVADSEWQKHASLPLAACRLSR
ncbi:MAG: hypothetical protein ACREO1_15185 [Arenimonas sp.]